MWIVEGEALVTPPLDGRQLPGTVRARLFARDEAREERIDLERLEAADEIFVTSSISGITPARLYGAGEARVETSARLRAELAEQPLGVVP